MQKEFKVFFESIPPCTTYLFWLCFFPLQKGLAINLCKKNIPFCHSGHSAQPTVCGFTYWLPSCKRRSNFSIVIRLSSHTAQEIDTNSISPCSCWNLEAQYELTQPFLAESSSDSPSLLCLSYNPGKEREKKNNHIAKKCSIKAEQFIINSTIWI